MHHRDDAGRHPAPVARDQRAPRSSSTTRPAPPRSAAAASAARWSTPAKTRGHQRGWCARAAATAVQSTALGGAAGDRVRPQAPHQPEHLQQGLSCVKGFCPSFVTVEAARSRSQGRSAGPGRRSACRRCPSPLPPAEQPWGIVVGGVGGTGVITIGQLLGMAAHLEGRASSRRTPAAWRRRAAPPGATSRSPTGPRPSTPPRSTPPRPIW